MSDARTTPHDLILAHLEGDLSPQEFATLNDLLRTRPDVRAMYRDLIDRSTALRSTLRAADTPAKPDAERPSVGRGVGISAPSPQSAIGNRQSKISPRPIPFIIYPISIAAALLFTAAIVGVYLFAFNTDPQPDPIKPNQPGPPVATLIENTGDLRTPHGYPAEGEDFSAGEYSLSTGTAEFMLTNAVNVKLRGKTSMWMRDKMNVSLTRGSAAFVVPTGAQGFTVHLPDGSRVVDLGTAFRVRIDDQGRARVRVTEGKVRLDAPDGSVLSVVEAGGRTAVADGRIAEVSGNDLAFGIDAEDAAAIAEAYPNYTKPINANIGGGVLRLVDTQQAMTTTASQATDGEHADFLEPSGSYTVTARIGASGGRPIAYSTQLRFASNAAIEFGHSDAAGNEYFRVIADDPHTNPASHGGIPVQVANIGFDIADGQLYEANVTVTRLADDRVTLDVTVADTDSDRVFEMDTLTIPAADVPLLLGKTDTIGFAKRGISPGTGVFADLAVTIAESPHQPTPSTGEKDTEPRGPGL